MADKIEITYLLNSGFLVRMEGLSLVFDCFRDEKGDVARAERDGDEMYFFASHAHFDHYSPMIAGYGAERFFLSEDIRGAMGASRFPAERTTWLGKYDGYEDASINVKSFDSTDEGTSFLVEAGGWRVFHAGDFNWWHWAGDTPENIGFAKNGFMKQMKRLDGMDCDVAFFPADGRLGGARSWGAREFCRRVRAGALVTMHSVGYPRWEPEPGFFAPGREIPYWAPAESGEKRELEKGGSFSP